MLLCLICMLLLSMAIQTLISLTKRSVKPVPLCWRHSSSEGSARQSACCHAKPLQLHDCRDFGSPMPQKRPVFLHIELVTVVPHKHLVVPACGHYLHNTAAVRPGIPHMFMVSLQLPLAQCKGHLLLTPATLTMHQAAQSAQWRSGYQHTTSSLSWMKLTVASHYTRLVFAGRTTHPRGGQAAAFPQLCVHAPEQYCCSPPGHRRLQP